MGLIVMAIAILPVLLFLLFPTVGRSVGRLLFEHCRTTPFSNIVVPPWLFLRTI